MTSSMPRTPLMQSGAGLCAAPLDRQATGMDIHAAPSARGPRPHGDGGAGGGLLDPVVIASLALLLANDHLFKSLARGTPWSLVTGKLSDVAGLVFLPVLVVAAIEVLAAWRGRFQGPSPRQADVVAVVVAALFAAMKTSDVVGDVYAWTLGALQWPVRAVFAMLRDTAMPSWQPVAHVVDPTDVIGVVGVVWVMWQTRRRALTRG
jgi:hypothetical protein